LAVLVADRQDPVGAATGERIVAFGRVGKRPEKPFFSGISALRAAPVDRQKPPPMCNGF